MWWHIAWGVWILGLFVLLYRHGVVASCTARTVCTLVDIAKQEQILGKDRDERIKALEHRMRENEIRWSRAGDSKLQGVIQNRR